MIKTALLSLLCFSLTLAKAQFFGRNNIGIHQGVILFNPSALNNSNNANNKNSWVNEFDKNFTLGTKTTFNSGIGFGNYQNPDNRFESYQSTNFLRIKIAMMIHLPQTINHYKTKPNLLNPYFKVGYNFDILNNYFLAVGNNRVNTNLRLGFGNAIRINHFVGLNYEFSYNQRVNPDYRTFFQHTFGLVFNLEEPFQRL
jgi:hypothetical protein